MARVLGHRFGHRNGRWDELFPTAMPGDEPMRSIRKETGHGPCQACGTITSWRYLGSYVWICSDACLTRVHEQIQRHSRQVFKRIITRIQQTTTDGSIVSV